MRKFLIVFFSFGSIILLSFYLVFILADGSTDAMYLKFTTPHQSSMVLGGSRAAQGIQPSKINEVLNRSDVYNYAFQNPSSPYGDIYLNSIKRKIEESNHNGLFILEVNPWNMTTIDSLGANKDYLTETNNFLEKVEDVTSNPNLDYLINSFDKRRITIIENRFRKGDDKTYLVKPDGWLEVTIKPDSLTNYSRRNQKLRIYTNKLNNLKEFSDYRSESLIKTVKFLKEFGDVYLVRLPVSFDMLYIENRLLPNFDGRMQEIAKTCNILYLNKTSSDNEYSYIDGQHLDIYSGRQFSLDLAKTIKDINYLDDSRK